MYSYTLIRSKRKTVAIHITEDASVEVRAPVRTPHAAIDAFVEAKEDWITARLNERHERIREREAFELRYGDLLPLCGHTFPIRAGGGLFAGYDGDSFFVPPDMQPEHIKRAVVMTYKSVARSVLEKKTAYYAKLLGVSPSFIKITNAKRQWGSCSGRNSISYSWRLIMADEDTVNYVVVHELAHIREHNHSDRFWEIVESVMPSYKTQRERLRELSDRLSREEWD